jgi:hypothetical protein
MRPDPGARRRAIGGDLGEPDRGLDRLDLAEKRLIFVKSMMTPMLEESGGLRRHLPLVRVRQIAPVFDVAANFIDDRGRVVFLLGGRQPVAGAKCQFRLPRRSPPPLRLRYRRDQLRTPPGLDYPIGRLPVLV